MYKSLINKQLFNAFGLLKDLKIIATFSKSKEEFDFESGSMAGETETIELPIVVTEQNDNSVTIIVKSRKIPDIEMYDRVTFSEKVWLIDSAVKGNGYTWLLKAHSHGEVQTDSG
jgi:hypothetical protein